MIILDTNQLHHAAFPHGAVMGMISKIAELNNRVLAIPEMVAVEDIAHHQHDVDQAIAAARKALTTLSKAFDADLTSRLVALSGHAAAQKRRAALEDSFTILPTPLGAAEEALNREAHRLPPAEQVWQTSDKSVKARGARDVLIWLTILEAVRSTRNDVWFVSQDNDFGKDDFHATLRREAQEKLGPDADKLRLLHNGIDQLLGELAEPAKDPASLTGLLQGEVIAEAVKSHITGPELFFRLLPHADVNDAGPLSSMGTEVKLMQVKRHKAYRVEDRTWVSAQLQWKAAKIYGHPHPMRSIPERGAGGLTLHTTLIEFKFDTTVLLETEPPSTVVSAEVLSMGPLEVLAVSQRF